MRDQLLFQRHQFHQLAEEKLKSIESDVASATLADLNRANYVDSLKKKYELRSLKLDFGAAKETVSEGAGSAVVVNVSIPFNGSSALLNCTPSQVTLNPPHGQVYGSHPESGADGTVTMTYEAQGADPESYKRWKDSAVPKLEQWIGFVNDDVTQHYGVMCQTIERAVGDQRTRLKELEDFKRSLQ